MFYGWGNNSEQWPLTDGNTLVFAYKYVSLMFIFKLAYKKKWFVVGDNRSEDTEVTRPDLELRYGPDLPMPGVWSQWGLLITVGVLVLLSIVLNVF